MGHTGNVDNYFTCLVPIISDSWSRDTEINNLLV